MDEYSDEISEYQRHYFLKGGRRVAVPLLHNMAYHSAIDRCEGCFQHIVGIYAYLFVRVRKVDLGSILCSSYVESDLILIRKGRHVLYGIVVTFLTVYNC